MTGKNLSRILLLLGLLLPVASGRAPRRPRMLTMLATGTSTDGVQKSGVIAKEGTAAADPSILPLGTRIRVHGADNYVGEFVVTDTGSLVKGRHIDIYFANPEDAKKFGKRKVQVEILKTGEGPKDAREEVKNGLTPPAKPEADK